MNKNDSMSILSLVFGILSILFGFASWLSIVGIIFGIAGIICARESFKNNPGNDLARAGTITSIVGIVLSSVLFIACTACVGCMAFYS